MAQGKRFASPHRSARRADRYKTQDHNRQCLERLEPYLREDKRAMKYLRREAERGIGIASAGPGGLTIDWD